MTIESLNCPNCGSGVSSDKTQCEFCRSRLKTMACPSCLGLMFEGSKYCQHCGALAVRSKSSEAENARKCPRCQIVLDNLHVSYTDLRECHKCDGLWIEVVPFESLCARSEERAAVLGYFSQRKAASESPATIKYVPCPECSQLMNRSNFAKASGVIIDVCKQHGVWCDAGELPRIFEFIRDGGMDAARKRERMEIDAERAKLRDERRQGGLANTDAPFGLEPTAESPLSVRAFIEKIFN